MTPYADISPDLLLRYDVQGPRYTSYPTAPVWTGDFGPAEWGSALRRANERPAEPLSLYVHLPYCESMCFFCGCSVIITQNRDKAARYVDVVLEEARLVAAELADRRQLGQHHWGGGTPTFLPPAELARLYRGIAAHFPAREGAEISIEVDPRVTTAEQLGVLHELGFNRISMGIQDFTPEVQQAIHRVQTRDQTSAVIDEARRLGFESVNVDLVYGLPFQKPETFAKTLDTVTAWQVDRVACYSYAHVPWLKKHQKAVPAEGLPSREEKFALLALALRHFGTQGYVAIGFDHFARPDDSLTRAARAGRLHRNFQGYSTRMGEGRDEEDMIALGMTAIGEVAGAFGQNHKTRKAWEEPIGRGELATERGWRRTPDDEERRRIILDLMCGYRVDFADYEAADRPPFRDRYARALAALEPMQEDGLVRVTDRGVQVSDAGRVFLRNLCMPFDAYLDDQQEAGRPVFSRTV